MEPFFEPKDEAGTGRARVQIDFFKNSKHFNEHALPLLISLWTSWSLQSTASTDGAHTAPATAAPPAAAPCRHRLPRPPGSRRRCRALSRAQGFLRTCGRRGAPPTRRWARSTRWRRAVSARRRVAPDCVTHANGRPRGAVGHVGEECAVQLPCGLKADPIRQSSKRWSSA